MSKLAAYQQWIARTRVPLLTFKCPACAQDLKTPKPPGDTLSQCPYCEAMFWKVTRASARVETILMAPGNAGIGRDASAGATS